MDFERKPDLLFDAFLVKPGYAKEYGLDCPLKESRARKQYLPGCYAWFLGEQVLYVGKAVRLRNRVGQHWTAGSVDDWIAKAVFLWMENHPGKCMFDCPDTDLLLSVWFESRPEALERNLIDQLRPLFNRNFMLPHPETVGCASNDPRSDARTPDGRSEKE